MLIEKLGEDDFVSRRSLRAGNQQRQDRKPLEERDSVDGLRRLGTRGPQFEEHEQECAVADELSRGTRPDTDKKE